MTRTTQSLVMGLACALLAACSTSSTRVGQKATVQFGTVRNAENVTLDSNAAEGALVGGMLGLTATESAPRGLISAAIGVVVGAGEIFGGGIAPIIAGNVTDRYGLPSALNVALTGVALGIIVCVFLRETAPSKTAAAAVRQPA